MNLLALETCFGKFSIALFKNGECVSYFESAEETKQAEQLIPAIEELLAKNNTAYKALNAIAVCVGPGSFTGLRIGLAAAKGYELALKIKLIGVSSLDAAAIKKGSYPVYLNANRSEAYFQASATSAPAAIPYVGNFDELPTALEVGLAALANRTQDATPLYIRKPDAKLPTERADYKKMAEMHAICFDKAWAAQEFHNYEYILDDGGFVAFKNVLGEVEIKTICVLPEFRRKGLAQKLMQQISGDKIFLEVEENNIAAISLYKKLGFAQFGSRKDYYGAGKNAILMSLQNKN